MVIAYTHACAGVLRELAYIKAKTKPTHTHIDTVVTSASHTQLSK